MPHRPSRRDFLLGASVGLGVGVPLGWFALREYRRGNSPHAISEVKPSKAMAMPGLFPGRVVEVHSPNAVDAEYRIAAPSVSQMIARGMCSLTGEDSPTSAWKRLFEKGDVVAIKVNPVGANGSRLAVRGAISNPQVLLEVVRNLKAIGIPGKDIIVFERYAREFVDAGYAALMTERDMDGVRWFASATQYTNDQVAIDGRENAEAFSPELLRHVVGYDPHQFAHMGFASPDHDPKDDRRFRSHLSLVVSQLANKIITLPVLKDHRSAGVTLSLKNMSHGFNNNVARSHIAGIAHGYPDSPGHSPVGPNQCNTFIPTAVNQKPIREKAVLHILDGLIGVYEGGPGVWNRTWGTWRANSLFFATDPVALDHVGWDIIDTKRTVLKLPRVGEMGRHLFTAAHQSRLIASGLGSQQLFDALTMIAASENYRGGGDSEVFDRRQPEHIYLAGTIGLGEFDLRRIVFERVRVG